MKRKVLFIPPVYFYSFVIFIIISCNVFKNCNLIKFSFNLIGLVFVIPGLLILKRSLFLFRKNNTPERYIPVKCLVCEGLYAHSRNPMYLGGLIILFGLVILSSNIIAFIFPALFFLIMNFMFIPFEEEKMEIELGQDYLKYKKRVRRWI